MLCTIYTDASHKPGTTDGAFAYFAKFGNETISKAEKIPGNCEDISYAEMYAIFRGVIEAEQKWSGKLKTVVIKTDNLQCVQLLMPDGWKAKKSPERKMAVKLRKYATARRMILKPMHVKAHTGETDFNSLLNNYCDRNEKSNIQAYPCTRSKYCDT